MAEKNLKLKVDIAAVTTDGNAISVNDTTGQTSLVFFQIKPGQGKEKPDHDAMAVAHIRLTMDELRLLKESLVDTVKNFDANSKK